MNLISSLFAILALTLIAERIVRACAPEGVRR